MILDNEFTVDAPVDRVWAYFLDVPNLAPCLPGATLVGDDGDGTYQGKVVAALGPVKLNFSGTARRSSRPTRRPTGWCSRRRARRTGAAARPR